MSLFFFTLILPYLIIPALRLLIYDIPILKLKETLNSDKKTISEAKNSYHHSKNIIISWAC